MRRWSIAAKLRAIITLACVATVALTCAIWVFYERDVVRQTLPVAQLVRAKILAGDAAGALAFSSPRDADEILGALRVDPRVTGAVIYDAANRPFARYLATGRTLRHVGAEVTPEGHRYGSDYLDVWVQVTQAGQRLGSLVVERNLDDLEARLRLIPLIALCIMAVAALAAYSLAGPLQRLVSEPIVELARTTAVVTEKHDYSLRARRHSEDEIGRLTDAFNAMLATIEASTAETKRLYEQVRLHATELETRVKERTAQLEDANHELEAFSYSVSHDLRGPLRYIAGYAQATIEEQGSSLHPQARGYLEKVVEQTDRMAALIAALLDFSRSGRQAVHPEPIDLGALAFEVFGELKAESPERDLRLRMQALPKCRADRILCRQVLVNLFSNAIKYTQGRAPGIILLGGDERDGMAEYFVRDNGVGFDPAKAGKLFTAFERLHDAQQYEGSGIGLASVKRMIQRQGGTIRAESALNVGSTFYFTLPL